MTRYGGALACLALSSSALGQPIPSATAQPGFSSGAPAPPGPPSYASPPSYLPPHAPTRDRKGTELTFLYATSVVYGVGLGVWFDAELKIDDPALFMIAPAILGLVAPAGVYALDHPPLRRGLPAAIAAGAVIGAGEGIGLASVQFVTSDEEDAWGFRGVSRATALGATLGAVGGVAIGVAEQPSPRTSVLLTSSVVWGGAIGGMLGYGTSTGGIGYGRANDRAAVGGLVGYNVGLVASAALSTVYIPTSHSLRWMWAGAGIGFAASLPVYLFYLEEDGPPAKRGLVFSATATTLGIAAGALFTLGSREESAWKAQRSWASITSVGPLAEAGHFGIHVNGEID